MQHRNGITKTELVVIGFLICFIVAMAAIIKSKSGRLPRGPYCSTNLKGLGTAMSVYANDYQDQLPQLPGTGPWSKKLGFAYDNTTPNFKPGGQQHNVDRTITASWYLLVREADVAPKSFVCSYDMGIKLFTGKNPKKYDPVELWDFGSEPHNHVSYTMHNPYGAYPAGKRRPADFAVAADMSPWFRWGNCVGPDAGNSDWRLNRILLPPYFSNSSIARQQIQQSNAMAHGREGQNVAFADGHSEYCKTTDVGVKHDNIYTFWAVPKNPSENDIRIGRNPTARDKDNDAQSETDSFLAI